MNVVGMQVAIVRLQVSQTLGSGHMVLMLITMLFVRWTALISQ